MVWIGRERAEQCTHTKNVFWHPKTALLAAWKWLAGDGFSTKEEQKKQDRFDPLRLPLLLGLVCVWAPKKENIRIKTFPNTDKFAASKISKMQWICLLILLAANLSVFGNVLIQIFSFFGAHTQTKPSSRGSLKGSNRSCFPHGRETVPRQRISRRKQRGLWVSKKPGFFWVTRKLTERKVSVS